MHRMPILLVLLAATGCSLPDPFDRPGTWRPTGANEANLRVMVANPADLRRGEDSAPADGNTAAAAVDRLRQGRVKPLPESAISRVGGGSGGLGAGAAPAP